MKRWFLIGILGFTWLTNSRAEELWGFVNHDPIPDELDSHYVKGLKYLVRTQKSDGTWEDQYGKTSGVIGLAVVSMLAHGDDPNVGPYAETIHRSIRYILVHSDPRTGQIGDQQNSMYSHGFATLALAEAYGMVDEPLIGPVLQRAVDFIIACQKRNPFGAWRYTAEDQSADTTVSGAEMVALFAARNAGINVPDDAIEKGLKFYASCQDDSGGIGYTNKGGSGNTRTAIGMLVYTLARQKDSPVYKKASGFLKANLGPNPAYPFYHEYYAAQATFHHDDVLWQVWNTANIKQMLRQQDSNGGWLSGNFGPCYSTSAALLSLALNYRYLPIYER